MSLSAGAIVGIVLGSIFLILILAYIIYTYWWIPHRNNNKSKTFDTVPDSDIEDYIKIRTKAAKLMSAYDDSEVPDIVSEGDDYETNVEENDTQEYFDNMEMVENPAM
jgi:hypothetical protein